MKNFVQWLNEHVDYEIKSKCNVSVEHDGPGTYYVYFKGNESTGDQCIRGEIKSLSVKDVLAKLLLSNLLSGLYNALVVWNFIFQDKKSTEFYEYNYDQIFISDKPIDENIVNPNNKCESCDGMGEYENEDEIDDLSITEMPMKVCSDCKGTGIEEYPIIMTEEDYWESYEEYSFLLKFTFDEQKNFFEEYKKTCTDDRYDDKYYESTFMKIFKLSLESSNENLSIEELKKKYKGAIKFNKYDL